MSESYILVFEDEVFQRQGNLTEELLDAWSDGSLTIIRSYDNHYLSEFHEDGELIWEPLDEFTLGLD